MKPIRILILVAVVAAWAAAQNTSSSSQNTGSGTQPNGGTKSQTSATPASGKTDSGSTSSHKTTSSNPAPGVKLIVPKPTPKTANTKNSPATSSASAKGASSTVPSKSAAQTSSSTKASIANNKTTGAAATGTPQTSSTKTSVANSKTGGAVSTTSAGANTKGAVGVVATKTPGGKPVATQKTPQLTVKPVQKPGANAKTASATPSSKKSVASKAVTTPKNPKVKIVPQKNAKDGKPGNNNGVPTVTAAGRRDPFLSIIRNLPTTPAGPNCSVGKRCLFIPELELKGIAKDPDGQMLAVVVSNTHRAYFLRENDQVFNGSVQKITSDSVVFREFATDHLGRETVHEVVKRIPKT